MLLTMFIFYSANIKKVKCEGKLEKESLYANNTILIQDFVFPKAKMG
jgi:hypothetical protein